MAVSERPKVVVDNPVEAEMDSTEVTTQTPPIIMPTKVAIKPTMAAGVRWGETRECLRSFLSS